MAFAGGYLAHANVDLDLVRVMQIVGLMAILYYTIGGLFFKDSTDDKPNRKLVKVSDDPEEYPEYKIVATSEEPIGTHDGGNIYQYLVMANDDVYEFDRVAVEGNELDIGPNELLLQSGLIYFKSDKQFKELHKELIENKLNELGIDTTEMDDIKNLEQTLKSIIETNDNKEDKNE
jgi:hypothetical protein